MWFIIVTCRSLLYTLLSIASLMAVLTALATPKWLIGKEETSSIYGNTTYRQTVGIYNRCTYVNNLVKLKFEPNCGIYATDFKKIDSKAWQACIVFFGASIAMLVIASSLALLAFCKQICLKKSVLNIAGVLQGIAGLLLAIALVLYPVGWHTDRIQRICFDSDSKAAAFKIGQCQLGISFYFAIGGCVGALLCAAFSSVADKSIFSNDVQEEILEGKHLVCVL